MNAPENQGGHMSRWETLKSEIQESVAKYSSHNLFSARAYEVLLKRMTELESVPVVEVEVPELQNGMCNQACPFMPTQNKFPYEVYYCSINKQTEQGSGKPGPNCPRWKGEKG